MQYDTGPGQGFHGEETKKDHDKSSYMPQQGYGNQVEYQQREPGFPYQYVIISNNRGGVIFN